MLYQGDDLINLMTVRVLPAEGETLPELEAVDIKIGCLLKHFDHPTNPFTVNIRREESIKLSVNNKVHAAIWYYTLVDGVNTLVKKTCEGTLTITTNPEVVYGGCEC